jgi:hypothetical protein
VTDEKRLHGTMADPGPAPTYDAHGFPLPFQVGDRVVNVDGDWCTVVEPGMRVALASDVPNTGVYWDDPATLRHLDERLAAATDSAGPASSSASPGGTGGLAEVDALLARLDAGTAALVTYSQMLREQMEGQRRAAWDSLVESARRQEQVPSDTQAGYTMGWRAAHDLLTGRHLEDHEYEALLAAELDSRYRKDRAKGGGSDGA